MFKLASFIFMTMIATGYFQEWNGFNHFPTNFPSGNPGGALEIHYGEPQILRSKPCPHRRSHGDLGGWTPIFKSKIVKPVDNDLILEPRALKNENIQDKNYGGRVDSLLSDPTNNTADNVNDSGSNLNSLSMRPNQRSNSFESLDNNEESFSDYDCDIDLGTDNYFDIIRNQEAPGDYKTTVGNEHKLIQMLNDCHNRKNIYNSEKANLFEEIPILSGRRSLSDSDVGNKNANDLKHAKEDEQNTTDMDINLTNVVLNEDAGLNNRENLNDRVPIKIHKVEVTLRPGKLLNRLQNPIISTGIADLPASRRMAESSRVCYACSTATNPSCWKPDSRTTIKYCHQEQNCITKTFGGKDTITLIRDCSTSCDSTSVGIEPKYKSCSTCHTDLCNSAIANSYNLVIIFIIAAFKYMF